MNVKTVESTMAVTSTSPKIGDKGQKVEGNREVNKDALRALHNNNQFAKVLFETGKKGKFGNTLTIENAVQTVANAKMPVSNSDIVKVFRAFTETNVGTLTVGRRGHLSRFEWAYPSSDACRYACGESIELEKIPTPEAPERKGRKKVLMLHVLPLRSNYSLKLKLPTNLTQQEAKKIIEFIDSLEKAA